MKFLPLVLALGGCNFVFDIVPTETLPETDSDRDGIKDPIDNCPLTANAEQGDRDDDTLGDACDPCVDGMQTATDDDADGVDDGCDICLKGSNHDEERDGFADACDVCPGVADDQADVDGDEVGDACDPDPLTMQRRVFFDGFGPPDVAWNTGFRSWHTTGDGYAPDDASVGNPLEGIWNPKATVVGRGIRVVVSVVVPSAELIADFQFLGVNLRQRSDGRPIQGCTISVDAGQWVTDNSVPLAAGAHVLTLDFQPAPNPAFVFAGCTVAGSLRVYNAALYDPLDEYVPSLLTTVPAEFEWIDVIE